MAEYLFQVSYTPEAWAAMIKRPQNRSAAVKTAIENLGGKIKGFWLSFGDHDVVGVIELPSDVNAAAFAIAVAGGGACKSVKTTPLLGLESAVDAMKKAGKSGYKPVGKK